MISPSALMSPLPVTVITSPGWPTSGASAERTGAPARVGSVTSAGTAGVVDGCLAVGLAAVVTGVVGRVADGARAGVLLPPGRKVAAARPPIPTRAAAASTDQALRLRWTPGQRRPVRFEGGSGGSGGSDMAPGNAL